MKKKIMSILLASVVCTSVLAGCSPDKGTSNKGTDSNTQPAPKPSGTKVTLASFPDQPKAALEAAIKAANLDFEVEIIEYPQNEYENKIKMAFGSQKSTDLILMDGPNIASYAKSGVLEPLDEYWAKDDFDDLVHSSKSAVVWNDQIWSAPLNESNTVLFYNKDVFEEANIVAPTTLEDTWTFDQLLEACEKVSVPGERFAIQPQMFSLANKNEGQTYTQMLWPWMSGGEIISSDGTTATGYFDSDATIAGVQFYADLFAKGYATTEDITNAFETGRVAMWVNGPWMIGIWREQFPELNWGAMPMPKDAKSASGSGSWSVAIAKSSQNKENAWKVIEALTGKEGMTVWCNETGNLPARKSVFDSGAQYKEYPYDIISQQLVSTAVSRPVTPVYPQISEAFMDCFNAVAFGSDVKISVDQATAKMNEALKGIG